jgi:diguanylate cyclase (GGDEF)-like protein/PAS domain S-box-containing protein
VADDSTARLARETGEDARTGGSLKGAVFSAMLDPIVILGAVRDAAGRIVDFQYLDANQAACDYNGLSRDELVGRRMLELFPGLADTQVAVNRRVVETGEPLTIDAQGYPNETFGGEERFYDIRAAKLGDGLFYTWRDVTERVERSEQLEAARTMYQLLAEQSPDVVLRFDLDGHIQYVSPTCESLVGYTPDELLGTVVYTLMHPEDLAVAQDAAGRVLEDGSVEQSVRGRIQCKDGSYRWVSSTARVVHGDDGAPGCVVATWRDAEVEVAEERALVEQAVTDDLTGLLTRRAGWARLQSSASDLRRAEGSLAILFCDLDGFKGINDTHGHALGDALLAEVAQRVLGSVRRDDYVVRIGGDEFLVVLNGIHELGEVEAIAEKVRAAVAEPMNLDGHDITITMSVGASLVRPDERISELIQRADDAMYKAKSRGGNKVHVRA